MVVAVTIDIAGLTGALRADDTDAQERAVITRISATAREIVTKYAPTAPDVIQNEAFIRVAGYLYDMPTAARGMHYASIGRNSGAYSLLQPYRKVKVGVCK